MAVDLRAWLNGHGLGEWIDVFLENQVDLDAARDLTEADLRELEIPMGPRKKLPSCHRCADRRSHRAVARKPHAGPG